MSTAATTAAVAALSGAATGLRSSSGITATMTGTSRQALPRLLRSRGVRPVTWAFAAGELLADKLPITPDRTDPSGLVPRAVLGGASAALLVRRSGGPMARSGGIGAVMALATAVGGQAARRRLSQRMPPLAAALVEDLVAAGLAYAAVRVARNLGA